ncbi:MAG TPA: hypothetical protein VFE78_04580 [Gemmataceae bacterium]|jgi:hypothetical protein|nr:hypothetical protein [Gemmataceae bacterium]
MSRPKPHPPVQVTAHPPERARRGAPVILPCGCCCCCCCCLHTVGGLAGGVVGSVLQIRPRPRPVDPDFPFPFRRDELDEEAPALPSTLLYWLLVTFLIAVTAVWYYVQQATGGPLSGNPQNLLIGLFIAVMILPGLQVGASVLATLAIALFYGEKVMPLIRVGKITLWSFVGTLAGLLLMGGCLGVFSLGNK